MELFVKPWSELTRDELYRLLELRIAVFVVEQQCPYLETDGHDRQAIHIWAEDERGVAGCLRLLPPGVQDEQAAIGRVVTRDRGAGVGRLLMEAAVPAACKAFGVSTIRLDAQVYAQGFYEKFGFRVVSEPFLEDGIPHVKMAWVRPD